MAASAVAAANDNNGDDEDGGGENSRKIYGILLAGKPTGLPSLCAVGTVEQLRRKQAFFKSR